MAAEYALRGISLWGLFAIFALVIVEGAVIFHKAKLPFWGIVVPIYNLYLVFKLANRSAVWMLLCLIPVVGLLVSLDIDHRVSKAFGHGVLFTLGLILLPPIFLGWIAFSADQYRFESVAKDGPDFKTLEWDTWPEPKF